MWFKKKENVSFLSMKFLNWLSERFKVYGSLYSYSKSIVDISVLFLLDNFCLRTKKFHCLLTCYHFSTGCVNKTFSLYKIWVSHDDKCPYCFNRWWTKGVIRQSDFQFKKKLWTKCCFSVTYQEAIVSVTNKAIIYWN